MIVTLTPNPSIDRTVTLPRLERGAVNRATGVRQDPGGKGVNVSRAVVAHGEPSTAVMPLGGPEGRMMTQLLADSGVTVAASGIAGTTRINLTLAGLDGVTTKVNEAGPSLDANDVDALVTRFADALRPGTWAVGAGSLPPGVPADFYARLVEAAHAAGARIAIDSSGAPFAHAIEAAPDLVKPNHHELGEVLGRELHTVGDVVAGAQELVTRGIAHVVVSLGGSGALLVTAGDVLHAAAGKVLPVSTVGAGDALLAGYLLATTRGAEPAQALAAGIRFGTAAVTLPGSIMPKPHDIEHVTVTFSTPLPLDAPVEE